MLSSRLSFCRRPREAAGDDCISNHRRTHLSDGDLQLPQLSFLQAAVNDRRHVDRAAGLTGFDWGRNFRAVSPRERGGIAQADRFRSGTDAGYAVVSLVRRRPAH